jgi:thymidylate kinase
MIKSDLEAKELQEHVLEHFKDLIEEGRKYVELVDNGDEIDHIEEDVEY